MRNDLTELVFVLDHSGSMYALEQTSIETFKKFIKEQLDVPGDISLSIYPFSTHVTRALFREQLRLSSTQVTIEANIGAWLKSDGWTALYDGINQAITEVGSSLAQVQESERPGKVIVITITDGFENASITDPTVLKDKIIHQQEKYKWEFIFVGANQDALFTAKNLGIKLDSALTYGATDIGTQSVMRSLNTHISNTRYACSAGVDLSTIFSKEERKAALGN